MLRLFLLLKRTVTPRRSSGVGAAVAAAGVGYWAGRRARKAQEAAERRENWQTRNNEWLQQKNARDAASHAITFEVQCPVCAAYCPVSMASDGHSKVTCLTCHN